MERYLSTSQGLDRLSALGAHRSTATRAEVPPPARPDRRAEPVEPTIRISRASDWVAGMQRSAREFAQKRKCPEPLVRVTLDDGERLFLESMTPGPGDDFVTFVVYASGDPPERLVVLRLDAIRKVELLGKPGSARERGLAFHPRSAGMGFASGS